jgi:hypothetical protein
MRYRDPFTPQQRRDAVREYQSFSANMRILRKMYPPTTGAQSRALKRYAKHVEAIGVELLKIDAHLQVEILNARIEQARYAMAEYFRVKHFGERGGS